MFFQNLFDEEFQGYLVLGDRHHSLTFRVPPNKNAHNYMFAQAGRVFNLTDNEHLTINFAYDKEFKNWAAISIDVSGADVAATTADEIVAALNADTLFSELYTAFIQSNKIVISARRMKSEFKTFISNTEAETKLKFNKRAGVAELPSFFEKHTIANRFNFPDGLNKLIRLGKSITEITADNPADITSEAHGLTSGDTIYIGGSNSESVVDGEQVVTVSDSATFTVPVNTSTAGTRGEWFTPTEKQILDDAGFNYLNIQQDYQLLGGRSGLFIFQKNTVDEDKILQTIEYHAGSIPGDLAKKINYTYSGSLLISKTEIPYVLTEDDILTP